MVKILHPTAGGRGSTLRWETKIPNVVGCCQKNRKKKRLKIKQQQSLIILVNLHEIESGREKKAPFCSM